MISGGQTTPAADTKPATPPGTSVTAGPGLTLGGLPTPSPAVADNIYNNFNLAGELKSQRIMDLSNMGLNFFTGLFNGLFSMWTAESYFDAQEAINDRKMVALETIEKDRQTFATTALDYAERADERHVDLAETVETTRANAAIKMHQISEEAKTQRSALKSVDEAFSVDPRSGYGLGTPSMLA